MNIYTHFEDRMRHALKALQNQGVLPDIVTIEDRVIEPARDPSHGDLVSNAALMLAAMAGLTPRKLAAKLADQLKDDADLEKIEIAGPGFLNLTLKTHVWSRVLKSCLQEGCDFGRTNLGEGKAIHIQISGGANPFDLYQARRAVFADAVAALLEFGAYRPVCRWDLHGLNGGTGELDQDFAALGIHRKICFTQAASGVCHDIEVRGLPANRPVKICRSARLIPGRNSSRNRGQDPNSAPFVSLRKLVNEVGTGNVRFTMLYRKNDAALDLDCDRVLNLSHDNPVFYVQYAHARACSVLKKAQQNVPHLGWTAEEFAASRLDVLTDEVEIALIKKLSQFPLILKTATLALEPHRVAFFVYELAACFHHLWTRGKELPHLRFMVESSRELTQALIALIQAAASVMRVALGLLGVTALSEMC